MTDRDDAAVSIGEDSFLDRLIPQVADRLAEQHTGDFDAGASRARFHAWLAGHTGSPARPRGIGGRSQGPAVSEDQFVDDPLEEEEAFGEDSDFGEYKSGSFRVERRDVVFAGTPWTSQAPQDRQPTPAPEEIKIGLWGAPQSGKTTFLAALRQARPADPADGRWVIHPGNDTTAEVMIHFTRSLVIEHRFPEATALAATVPLRWRFVGDLAGSRFDRRKLRRRAPVPSEFILSVTDVAGSAYADDLGAGYMPPDVASAASNELATAQGLLYFFDPVADRETRDSAEYLNRTIIALSRRMSAENGLVNGYLPHHVAVCITKFDHPAVLREALQHRLVTFGPDGMPWISGKNAETLFNMICEDRFWAWERDERDASSARFIRDELRTRFHPDRIHYFATSAIGFYQPPGQDPATGQPTAFDPDDHTNFYLRDGMPAIRGPITPINVLEPLLTLRHGISGIARTRPLRLVPTEYTEGSWRRRA
jgi:hypothetical protein